MNDRIDVSRSNNDGVLVPRIWVAFALSILIHIAALWELPPITVRLPGASEAPGTHTTLTLRLIPPTPAMPPVSPAPAQPAPRPTLQAQRPKTVPRPQPPSAPPVIALSKPAPATPSPATVAPPVPETKPAVPAMGSDLASYIEAQRRARGTPAPPAPPAPVNDDDARSKRIIAGNLGSHRDRTFGYDPTRGGGMFQIERLSVDYAEFHFYGWSNDIGRNTKQLIEVRRGNNSDIRIAVVRKMIAIIRGNTQEDFLWVSARLGRSVMLSAHPKDNAGLEAFMMDEFFYAANRAQ